MVVERPEIALIAGAIATAIHNSREAMTLHQLHGLLLIAAGCRVRDVAAWFGTSTRSVERWVYQYNISGIDGLRKRIPRGRPARITAQGATQLACELHRIPQDCGYDALCWQGPLLQQHLLSRYGVNLSLRQCQRLLHRLRRASAPIG